MSWWVYLKEGDEPVSVARHSEGGTRTLYVNDVAELNVTYNYSGIFQAAFDGIHYVETLDGKQAQEVIPLLERAVQRLGDKPEPNKDYWAKTEGNAGHALAVLLGWARQHPQAVFTVH